ncbi:MAG: metalloregulator ArsR/SmtB family transcription factor [Magnetococcales bacterium]|nr:metalloregulator ArsR/SmtB family transcription factor [Magnetococcales bacterium]
MTPDTLFKSLVDETRRRCVVLLTQEVELCVCELVSALEQIQPKVSRHLAILRKDKVLQERKAGQWVFYRLHPELPAWAMTIIQAMVQGVKEDYRADWDRLQSLSDRPGRCATECGCTIVPSLQPLPGQSR